VTKWIEPYPIGGQGTGGLSDGLKGFITPDIAKILKYLDTEVARNGYLMAEGFTGADIQMSYVVEIKRSERESAIFERIAWTKNRTTLPFHLWAKSQKRSQ
jgi:glutathione S-transferase